MLSLDRDHVRTATTTPFPIGFLPGDLVDVDSWLRTGGEPEGVHLAFRDWPWDQPVALLSPGVVALQRTQERVTVSSIASVLTKGSPHRGGRG